MSKASAMPRAEPVNCLSAARAMPRAFLSFQKVKSLHTAVRIPGLSSDMALLLLSFVYACIVIHLVIFCVVQASQAVLDSARRIYRSFEPSGSIAVGE